MLHVFNENGGTLKRYDSELIETNIYNREFQLNVMHNTATHEIKVYINGKLKLTTKDNGFPQEGFWYFKTGVYAQGGASEFMEVYVRDVTVWQK